MQKGPWPHPCNRCHPHPARAGPPSPPSLPRASRPPLPLASPSRSASHPHAGRSPGPGRRPQRAPADSPCSPAAFQVLLPSLSGLRHIPKGGLPREPRRGGAEQSRAELAALPGSRPTQASAALPAAEQRARLPRAKVLKTLQRK
ncbi:splicing factor 3A subunit 2-like [Lagenorhynchus albirostris]|uniref:splicing factor 3A subunit 2-like n=1 Tax=Lagenorhynchus albirostris TaxID=27610 RepID=UPI0028EEF4FE|nr:splicing factor 3A subunit 2-like [Lagenorhynchus albirostris]